MRPHLPMTSPISAYIAFPNHATPRGPPPHTNFKFFGDSPALALESRTTSSAFFAFLLFLVQTRREKFCGRAALLVMEDVRIDVTTEASVVTSDKISQSLLFLSFLVTKRELRRTACSGLLVGLLRLLVVSVTKRGLRGTTRRGLLWLLVAHIALGWLSGR